MNKREVLGRPGWTAGRVDKFLVVEQEFERRGMYGRYTEYEYSLPQVLDAEKSQAWRMAAAKYLKVAVSDLDAEIAAIPVRREIERGEWEAQHELRMAVFHAEMAAKEEEYKREAIPVRGGLRRIGCSRPLSDGWRSFSEEQVLEYIDFADRRGRIDGDYIREFYRLWSAGAGYCNAKGVLRRLIAPVKDRLVRIVTYMARKNQWVYGVGSDGRGGRVLYIDTPGGQVSFHLVSYESGDYPTYPGTWSGVRNSDAILAQLFDPPPTAHFQ